jgi:hypothetical protein
VAGVARMDVVKADAVKMEVVKMDLTTHAATTDRPLRRLERIGILPGTGVFARFIIGGWNRPFRGRLSSKFGGA